MTPSDSGKVSFACVGCGKAFTVPASLAGRTAKCKACGHSVHIPAVAQATCVTPPVAPGPKTSATPPKLPPRLSSISGPPPRPIRPLSQQPSTTPTKRELVDDQSFHFETEPRGGTSSRSHGLHQRVMPRTVTPAKYRRLVVISLLFAVGACIAAVAYRPQLTQKIGAVARSASQVVPAARVLSPVRVIRQDEVDTVIRQASLNDISSKNVYQQMATFSLGAMKMSSLVALSYGATSTDIDGKLRAVDVAEIGTQTVHQQTAVYLEGMQILLAAAAKASGVASAKVDAVLSQVRISDIGSKTVHQQCANYCSGCLQLAELLAAAEGASSERIRTVMSGVRTNDITADTVHQQNVAYLSGLAQMLALTATSRGAANAKTEAVLQEMRLADISARTVFQQEVNALMGVMKLLGVLAVGT